MGEHATRLLDGRGLPVARACAKEAECCLTASHPRLHPECRSYGVGAAHDAARHHVGGVADPAGRMRERRGGNPERLRHADDGDTGLVLADARIVVNDGAGAGLEREIGSVAPAMGAGDDHSVPGGGAKLGGRVGEHDLLGQVRGRHRRFSALRWGLQRARLRLTRQPCCGQEGPESHGRQVCSMDPGTRATSAATSCGDGRKARHCGAILRAPLGPIWQSAMWQSPV